MWKLRLLQVLPLVVLCISIGIGLILPCGPDVSKSGTSSGGGRGPT